MTITKLRHLQTLIISSIILTLLIWLSQIYIYNGWYFTDTIIKNTIFLKYLGKATAFITTILICWSFILSANYKFLRLDNSGEQIGLNKQLTRWAFWLMFLDPIFLSLMRLYNPGTILSFFQFRSWSIGYGIGFNIGIILIILIILLTLVLKQTWLDNIAQGVFRSFFGLIPFLILLHVYFLEGDIKKYPVLGIWMLIWLAFSIVSFINPIYNKP